jgi:hypothetical protein
MATAVFSGRLGGLYHRYSWQQAAWDRAAAVVLSLIAKIEIIDEVHRAASLVAESDPKDTVAGTCPSRWLGGCLRKSAARLE